MTEILIAVLNQIRQGTVKLLCPVQVLDGE